MTFLSLLAKYQTALLGGLLVTTKLSLITWSNGLLLGGALGVLGARSQTVGSLTRIASFVMGSIPIIVILVWAYYPAQVLVGVTISPFWTAACVLSFVNILVVADIVRPALVSFPREFVVAGRICGMKQTEAFRYITFPLLMRQVLPSLLFSQVAMLHATLFASLISLSEIFRVTQQINALESQPVALYTALALLFLLISAPINAVALLLRKRYSRDFSEV